MNAVTYLDMAVRGRPVSRTPEESVDKLAALIGVRVPGRDEQTRANRVGGVGALLEMVPSVLPVRWSTSVSGDCSSGCPSPQAAWPSGPWRCSRPMDRWSRSESATRAAGPAPTGPATSSHTRHTGSRPHTRTGQPDRRAAREPPRGTSYLHLQEIGPSRGWHALRRRGPSLLRQTRTHRGSRGTATSAERSRHIGVAAVEPSPRAKRM